MRLPVGRRLASALRVVRKRKTGLPGGEALAVERRLTYRFSILSSLVIRCVAAMYGPKYRLLPSGWKAMAAIGRFGPVSAKEVCAHTTVQPDKITRAVDRMVELGLVVRRKDAVDRRRIVLSLSAAGERAYRDIERVTRRVEIALLDVLSSREHETFNAILDKLELRAQGLLLLEKNAWRRLAKPRSRRRRTAVTGLA